VYSGQVERVRCNLCGADDTHPFLTVGGLGIVRCRHCGLVYTDPRPVAASLPAIYGEQYYHSTDSVVCGYDDYLGEKPNIVRSFERRLRIVEHYVQPQALLDVGCSFGFLLEMAQARGWRAKGVELSPFAGEYARQRGLDVRTGGLPGAHFESNEFQLVTLWDVIEHVPDPQATLQEIRCVLAPGGVLSLITPNRGSLHARLMSGRWVEYQKPDEHLYFFSVRTLSAMLRQNGFTVLDVCTAGKYVSWEFALNRLRSYSQPVFDVLLRAARRLGWAERTVYVDPHDKMMLTARRV
jgi:SAM-dependent methyltransferase